MGRRNWIGIVAGAVVLSTSSSAIAHVERTSIWPDPAADKSIFPAAGGKVPEYRTYMDPAARLRSFTRLVRRVSVAGVTSAERKRVQAAFVRLSRTQQRRSMRTVRRIRTLRSATTALGLAGLQAPQDAEDVRVVCQKDSLARLKRSAKRLPASERRTLVRKNLSLQKNCRYHEIQAAVTAADNNDDIIVMPGFYTEESSRSQPTQDPRCAELRQDSENGSGAVTYAYQAKCPNDQNLVAVIGRETGGDAIHPGKCLRCNLQIEGSGAKPADVVIEAGSGKDDGGQMIGPQGDGKDRNKDVPLRGDRADGIYLRNFTVRHGREHGVYILETDGYTIDNVKTAYHGEYGFLLFVSDHGYIHDTEAVGNGDSGIYPGAAPDSKPRLNTLITRNSVHHNLIGYSGTMGNSTHVVDNDFYDNAVGVTTDSFFAGGHPGYPQDSAVFEGNRIYANNFDVYGPKSDVRPTILVPVGTGLFIAGGNDDRVQGNYIYDNWRRGTMLVSVPDALSNGTTSVPPTIDSTTFNGVVSTSHRNLQMRNSMGLDPDGKRLPNGVDFWWDGLGQGNCWQSNGTVTSDPASLPDCDTFPNLGTQPDPTKAIEEIICAFDAPGCDWRTVPAQPGSAAARQEAVARAGAPLALPVCSDIRRGPDGICPWWAGR